MKSFRKTSGIVRAFMLFSLVCCGTGTAFAQGASVKEKLSEEQTQGVWKAQVDTTAEALSLPADKHDRLAEVYINNRKARRQASGKLSKLEQGSSEKKELSDKLNDEAREKLRADLAGFLTKEQVEQAVQSLGSFNPRWDRYTIQILEFELDDSKEKQALRLAYDYVVEYGKARAAAEAADDRLSSVIARDLKSNLDTGMAKILDKDQLAKWTETTAFRSGGGADSGRKRSTGKGE